MMHGGDMQTSGDRDRLLKDLRVLLHDLFIATEQNVAPARLARAHGYTDGYMKALLQTGMATQRELLGIVSEERERAGGPPIRVVTEYDLYGRKSA